MPHCRASQLPARMTLRTTSLWSFLLPSFGVSGWEEPGANLGRVESQGNIGNTLTNLPTLNFTKYCEKPEIFEPHRWRYHSTRSSISSFSKSKIPLVHNLIGLQVQFPPQPLQVKRKYNFICATTIALWPVPTTSRGNCGVVQQTLFSFFSG